MAEMAERELHKQRGMTETNLATLALRGMSEKRCRLDRVLYFWCKNDKTGGNSYIYQSFDCKDIIDINLQ